jgi:2-keto-4-pentenoate hydratase
MRQVLYGPKETLAAQYRAIERLLSVEVLELRYTDLDWAVDRLRMLAEEGK